MSISEMIYNITPISEIQEAVESLLNAGKNEGILTVQHKSWYEVDGNQVELYFDDGTESTTDDFCPDDEDEDLILKISGMPIIQLSYYPLEDNEWWLLLSMDIPKKSESKDVPSLYALFTHSHYQSLFSISGEKPEFENVLATVCLGKDINTAAKLISYYIRYYGCDRDEQKYNLRIWWDCDE